MLSDIFNNADIFMLILVRMIGFLTVLPVLGGKSIPATVRLAIAMSLSLIVFGIGDIKNVEYENTLFGYMLLILKEFFVGFIISFVVYFMFNTVYLAGHFTDQQIGYSLASTFDPVSNTQVPITGNLYYFSICALFIVNRGHQMLITAIVNSYKLLPIGSAYIIGNNGLFFGIIAIMVTFFTLGFLIALPIVGVVLVADITLGVLVRTVPKMNVFVVGLPLKVIAGLLALWIIVPVFSDIYIIMYNEISKLILNTMRVMIK